MSGWAGISPQSITRTLLGAAGAPMLGCVTATVCPPAVMTPLRGAEDALGVAA